MVCLVKNSDRPLREVALEVGITERAVQRIIADLEDGGYLMRERIGRQNSYSLILDKELRHPIEAHHTIGDIVRVLSEE